MGLMILLLAWVAARALAEAGPDFEYFYKAGAWLLSQGGLDAGIDRLPTGQIIVRGSIEWYLPFFTRLMTVFAWMPLPWAGLVWLLINIAALVGTLRLIGRNLLGLPPGDWPVTLAVPMLLLLFFWHWEFRLNQVNNLTLFFLVLSYVLWEGGRSGLAGFWLGLAVLIKITPGLVVVWFLLKRQYRTVAVALLTVVLAGPVSDLIVFRPAQTIAYYESWLHNAVSAGSHRGLIMSQREMDWRNQGMGAVASRWLHDTSYHTRFDNDPRIAPEYPFEPVTLNVVNWPRARIVGVVISVAGLSLLGLLMLARKPASALNPWQLRFEWALFVMAMLWFMPVMRRYHMIWTFPTVALLGAALHYAGHRGAWARTAWASLTFLVAAQLAVLSRDLEAGGVLLIAVGALAIPAVWLLVRMLRNPSWLPEDYYAAKSRSAPTQPPLRERPIATAEERG